MIAYEIYWGNQKEREHLIGILPERRKDLDRITVESIKNWGRMILGNSASIDSNSISIVRVEV
jgi:hypothetical protein